MDASWFPILEWVAAGLGLVNIALLVRRSVWNYAFGMAMVAIYVFVFYESRLYAESGLQVFFFAAQGWGWWLWARARVAGTRFQSAGSARSAGSSGRSLPPRSALIWAGPWRALPMRPCPLPIRR
jgi:nicotinamide riboside transporter PnuC